MSKLFGTDGIRGQADQFPLDDQTIRVIGQSLAKRLEDELGRAPQILTGRDTRESGLRIEAAFHTGAIAAGAKCESAGVMTTPGVAHLTGAFGLDAGVVISASHNPYTDNGIKLFSPSGRKLGSEIERQIEADVAAATDADAFESVDVDASRSDEFAAEYLQYLRNAAHNITAGGLKIVVDCANGAASHLGPELFKTLGCQFVAINNEPDGRNINKNSGSLHLDRLVERVVAEGADLGVAFDGDADRALFVDETGNIVDGDSTLWIMARYMQDRGGLRSGRVVATVMSNIGLELALRSRNIELIRTDVGDKYVLEELLSRGSEIGGEQSGHIIFPATSLVGDGMMTTLHLLEAMISSEGRLSALTEGFQRYPQILVNVPVRQKLPFDDVDAIRVEADETRQILSDNGRLLLRYSGTENLARVMIEGQIQSEIDELAHRLADKIGEALA